VILSGDGRRPPRVKWPGGTRVVISVVLNYEEGAERNLLDGDQPMIGVTARSRAEWAA